MTDIDPEERVFDRIPHHDPRSDNYPIRRAITPDKPPRSYTWRHIQLDQGREGACVYFMCTMEAAARPKPFWGDPVLSTPELVTQLNTHARLGYKEAQKIDPWPGEDYEGTSVTAGLTIGVRQGYWRSYLWADSSNPVQAAAEVVAAVGYRGPVCMGTNWWTGMYRANPDGYLEPTGRIVGGHAWLITRYSASRNAVWTPNSWGGSGQGWIRRNHLIDLLADDGEAALVQHRLWAPRT